MSNRRLDNWLDAYFQYTFDTESASIFHKWVGFSTISGAMQKKVWFNFGRFRIHPNLFVVLVAEPGIARKTKALELGEDITAEITTITRSADCITPQALLEDLELAGHDEEMSDGSTFKHNSLSIISGEFESFLGQKTDNKKMLVLLTDLFDCKHRPYRYRTKASGTNVISSVFLNLQAATTPDSLASSLPTTAIGGGLTTRIIFVWADDKSKKVSVPELTKPILELKQDLIVDLSVIHRIVGGYNFTKESRKWWDDWYYNKFNERDPARKCKDPAFNGWYTRKPVFVIKLAMILSAAKHSQLYANTEEFEEALKILDEVEAEMACAFSGVGRSEIATDVALCAKIIEREGIIYEKTLLHRVWRDIDANKWDNVSATLIKRGDVKRTYEGPKGADGKPMKGVWYKWVG